MDNLYIINEKPIRTKHIAWYTEDTHNGSGEIALCEVYEATYRHPLALEEATHKQVETRFVCQERRVDREASTWVLLEAAQAAVSQSQKDMV
jgi:hypothetical protein